MRYRLLFFAVLLMNFGTAHAQWAVFDFSNLTQNIINSSNEIAEAVNTTTNVVNTFRETEKIYRQGKEYYDKLRNVSNLVRSARKIQQCILLVGDITDTYINGFRLMATDQNFTARELSAIAFGYTKILQESTYLIKDLQTFIKPSDANMTDRDRLDMIDRIYLDLLRYRNMTSYYTRKNISVSVLRAKDSKDRARVLSLYGTANDKYW